MAASRYCCRCDKPILPGQASAKVDRFSASGGGITLYEHTECPPPQRNLPVRRRPRYRLVNSSPSPSPSPGQVGRLS